LPEWHIPAEILKLILVLTLYAVLHIGGDEVYYRTMWETFGNLKFHMKSYWIPFLLETEARVFVAWLIWLIIISFDVFV
jgi:hypothetical protein